MKIPSGFYVDNPAFPLLQASITYWGITDVAGDALGLTLRDTSCSTAGLQPNYAGQVVKILDGGAAGQVRPIAIHDLATGIITVAAPWTDYNGAVQVIAASTRFVILSSAGGGGVVPPAPPPPSVGLWMFGHCSPAMSADDTTIVCPNLAGLGDDIFNDEFWCQAIKTTVAATARQIRRITDYDSATGTFTVDPFANNLSPGDDVAIFHESIMGIEIMGFGTLTTSDVAVPRDAGRAALYSWENDGYFSGALLIPTEGDCRMQARRIINYTRTGGFFYLDPNYPFSQAPGQVDYLVVNDQCGYSWPYVQALVSCIQSPQVDQNNIEVARLSIHNLRPDAAVIPATEYSIPVINIDRYRPGVDAAWNNIVIAAAMTQAAGYAYYTYTFPSAAGAWQDGDLVRFRISGCVLTIPAAAVGANFYVPAQTAHAVVGGVSAIIKKVNLIFDIVNSILKLNETGGSILADGTEQTIYINDTPLGIYEPRKVKIDTSNMDWGDSIILRWYERLNGMGTLTQKDEWQLDDLQESPIKNIELEPNRFGLQVTLTQIAGTYRNFAFEILYEI